MSATMKDKINTAFRRLRAAGYFARQSFMCCQSCAGSAIPEDREDAYVYYHKQDTDALYVSDDRYEGGTYLAWAGDGAQIVDICRAAGLDVEWDGSVDTRIWIGTKLPEAVSS